LGWGQEFETKLVISSYPQDYLVLLSFFVLESCIIKDEFCLGANDLAGKKQF
jgi:hypothetical protein